ncbi:S49 family peptidase [Xanthobacteraceae bacterium Astr-EGSB]|uniref:S49 family peptidase n=1 Tax=Astrobacterium formosum TaxID=3069710 RepID=UPI0027AFBABE|nr:S49 family peptidase [Xanthobacteraceae bacterium Astr-EGSB]
MTEHLRQLGLRARDLIEPVLPRRWRRGVSLVPVVRLSGVIGFSTPLRPGLTIAGIAKSLDRAFGMRKITAVALVINSPGGSAVQSHLIHRRIRDLAAEKGVPVIAFVEDVAASGGYMIACAADEIVCDPSSIVGSIGVVGATFGFDEAIRKLGIERRVYTAGERKVMLDPFLPENPDDVARLKAIQHEIHDSFIDLVKERRGERLSEDEPNLFSGEYWAAKTALGMGLVDRLGELRAVLRERYGEEVLTPLVSAERGLFGRRQPGVAGPFAGPGIGLAADDIISALETRALWSRYGL